MDALFFSFLFSIGRLLIVELLKFGRHRRVPPSQFLDRYVLRLVVCKTKVPIRSEQGILCLLHMVD